MRRAFQSWIVLRYSLHFGSANVTVQSARFHVRPRNVDWSEKGMSLEDAKIRGDAVNVIDVVTELVVSIGVRGAQGQVSKQERVILIEFLDLVICQ